jgi:hypothetical protein
MIESLEKQKRILDYLERWALNCRIKWLLRDNDLNSLSWVITEEFYNVCLSCGHLVRSPYWEFMIEAEDNMGTTIGNYCLDCAKKMLKCNPLEVKLVCTYYDNKAVRGKRVNNILAD